MISVACPTCGNSFEAPPASAGQAVNCPDCKELVRVPGRVPLPKWWEKPAGIRAVIAGAVAAVAIAALFLFTRRTHETAPRVASAAPAAPASALHPESDSIVLRRSQTAAPQPRSPGNMHSVLSAELEGVRVAISLVTIDHLPVDDHGTRDETEKDFLMIGLNLSNKTPQIMQFSGWGHGQGVTLVDNFGNHYARVHAPAGTAIVGQCETASMLKGRPVTDMLAFKPPRDDAEYLTLELPAANFGGQGTLTFKIARLAWLKNNDGG